MKIYVLLSILLPCNLGFPHPSLFHFLYKKIQFIFHIHLIVLFFFPFRIMSEEHGYQRSRKKCREKFENLYKYYKKTKEGKAGRQDGKHYRFFCQLEALYGETSNTNSVPESHIAGHGLQFHTIRPEYHSSKSRWLSISKAL